MFGDFRAISIKHLFLVKTVVGTFWVTFGKFWATFDFIIWSHCFRTSLSSFLFLFVSSTLTAAANHISASTITYVSHSIVQQPLTLGRAKDANSWH